jgi:hypothetical protein
MDWKVQAVMDILDPTVCLVPRSLCSYHKVAFGHKIGVVAFCRYK